MFLIISFFKNQKLSACSIKIQSSLNNDTNEINRLKGFVPREDELEQFVQKINTTLIRRTFLLNAGIFFPENIDELFNIQDILLNIFSLMPKIPSQTIIMTEWVQVFEWCSQLIEQVIEQALKEMPELGIVEKEILNKIQTMSFGIMTDLFLPYILVD